MRAIVLLAAMFLADDIPDNFRAYFERAEAEKSVAVEKLKKAIADSEVDLKLAKPGPKKNELLQGITAKKKALESVQKSKPIAYLEKDIKAGDVGHCGKVKILDVLGGNIVLAAPSALITDNPGIIFSGEPAKSFNATANKSATPDQLWIVKSVWKSEQDAAQARDEIRAAVRRLKELKRESFILMESVPKSELNRHWAAYEATKK